MSVVSGSTVLIAPQPGVQLTEPGSPHSSWRLRSNFSPSSWQLSTRATSASCLRHRTGPGPGACVRREGGPCLCRVSSSACCPCVPCGQLLHRRPPFRPRTACSSCLFLPRRSGPRCPQDGVHAKCTFLNFAVLCLGLFNKKGKTTCSLACPGEVALPRGCGAVPLGVGPMWVECDRGGGGHCRDRWAAFLSLRSALVSLIFPISNFFPSSSSLPLSGV